MSAEHKAALAVGREQSRAVRDYLDMLEMHRPKRGRRRTPDSIKKRLAAIEEELAEATAFQRLGLLQEQADLEEELETLDEKVDLTAYEKAFVKHARAYAEAKGISYGTFRRVGVAPDVLAKAGITRGM